MMKSSGQCSVNSFMSFSVVTFSLTIFFMAAILFMAVSAAMSNVLFMAKLSRFVKTCRCSVVTVRQKLQ